MAYPQAPAEGQWQDGEQSSKDDIVIFEVMVDDIYLPDWRKRRAELARTAVPAGHGDHQLHANAARIEAVIVYPSTSIRKTEYDPETRVLWVWFVASGRRYDYEAVPPETYAAPTRLRKGPVLQRPLSRPFPAPPDCRSIAIVACTRRLMRRFRSLTRWLALIPGSPCGVGKSTAGPGRPST
jgi:hypothetical protein